MFGIEVESVVFDGRDAIVGSRTSRLPMTYGTLGLAAKLAELRTDLDGYQEARVFHVPSGRLVSELHVRIPEAVCYVDDGMPF